MIAVHASARVQPSRRQMPFAWSSAASTRLGKWRRSSSLGQSGNCTNRCQCSVLRRGKDARPFVSLSATALLSPTIAMSCLLVALVTRSNAFACFLLTISLLCAIHFYPGNPDDHPDCPSHARLEGKGSPVPNSGQAHPLHEGHCLPTSSSSCCLVHHIGWRGRHRLQNLRVEDVHVSTPESALFLGDTCATIVGYDPPVCSWAWSRAGKGRPWTLHRGNMVRNNSRFDRRQLLHRMK